MKRLATAVVFTCGLQVFVGLTVLAADINLQIVAQPTQITAEKEWDEYPTLGQAVAENSNVNVRSDGEGGNEFFVFRGYNKGVQIYLDGVPLPQDITGLTNVSLIPTAIIDKIEIVEGFNPASPQATGSVYITTKRPIDGATVFDTTAFTGSDKTNLFSLGLRSDIVKIPYNINYSRNTSDGFQENSAYDKQAVNLSFTPLKGQTLSYTFLSNRSRLPGGTDVPISQWNGIRERVALTPNDFLNTYMHQASYNGRAERLKYGAAYSNTRREGEAWGPVQSENQDIFTYAEYAVFDFLAAGASFKYSGFTTLDPWAMYNKTGYYWNEYSAYMSAALPNKIVDIDLGARYDYHDLFHSNVSGKIKLSKGGQTKVYAAAASGKILPSIADYDKHIAPLRPETNTEFELGLEGSYTDFNFKIVSYIKFIDDKIKVVEVPPGSWQYFAENIGNARIIGLDVQAVKTIGVYRITAIYSLSDNKVKPYGEGAYVESPYAPQHVLSLTNALNLGSWRAIGTLYGKSKQYTDIDKTGQKLPGYADIELSLEKKIGNASLFGAVSNVLDTRYAINGGFGTFYPCAGRTYRLGVRYQFST